MNEITDKKIQSWINQAAKLPTKKTVSHNIMPNLWLRITTHTKTSIFIYRVVLKNTATWYTIGEYPLISLHDARQKAIEIRKIVKQGINPNDLEREQKAQRKTVREIFNLMMDNLKVKGITKNSIISLTTFSNNYLSPVEDKEINDLTPKLVRTLVIEPLIKVSKLTTAKMVLLRFKQLSTFAYEREYSKVDILARLKNDFFTSVKCDRVLNDKEIIAALNWLYTNNDTPCKQIILSLMLGTRMNELLNLTWDRVDFNNGTILLSETKNKSNLLIKLPPQALQIIQQLHNIKIGNYVFANGRNPFNANTVNSRILALLKDTGINKFTHHDLRRTFSSKLAEMGYSLDLIDSATNHKLQGIRQNYVHTNRLDERYSMLSNWCNYLGSLANA